MAEIIDLHETWLTCPGCGGIYVWGIKYNRDNEPEEIICGECNCLLENPFIKGDFIFEPDFDLNDDS